MLNIKKDFPWFKINKGWTYLDSAASSLKPQCVIDKINEFNTKYGFNPHNNDSPLTSQLNNIIVDCRKTICKFLNSEIEETIFTSGATDGLNIIVNNIGKWLKPNDEVIVSYNEHASNLLPWLKQQETNHLKLVYAHDQNGLPSIKEVTNLITKKTKVVSLSTTSNLFGLELDPVKLCKAIKEINKDILIVLDCTQYLPGHKIDVKKTLVDFLVFSGHKMCGPTGIGIMYGKKIWLEKFDLIKLGGGMSGIVSNNHFTIVPLPQRLEAGTIHSEGIIGLAEAIKYLEKIGFDKIIQHKLELKKYFDEKVKTINNGLIYYNYQNVNPIFPFNIDNIFSQDLAHYLGQNKIIVRSGMSCVKLQEKITKCAGGVVRASLYIYNTKEDIDYLIKILKKFEKKHITANLI